MLDIRIVFSILLLCKYYDMWSNCLNIIITLCIAILLSEKKTPIYNGISVIQDSFATTLLVLVALMLFKITNVICFSLYPQALIYLSLC